MELRFPMLYETMSAEESFLAFGSKLQFTPAATSMLEFAPPLISLCNIDRQ